MTHYDRFAAIARDLGLEPVQPSDGVGAAFAKLVAILAAYIERTDATIAQLTPRKPGRPRKE